MANHSATQHMEQRRAQHWRHKTRGTAYETPPGRNKTIVRDSRATLQTAETHAIELTQAQEHTHTNPRRANDSDRQHSRRMAQVACFFFIFSSFFFQNVVDDGDRFSSSFGLLR